MKFKKIKLNESLMDDFVIEDHPINWVEAEDIFRNDSMLIPETDHSITYNRYDDDFSAPEYMPEVEPIQGPDEGSDTGIADLLITSINDEWETIRKYNSLIATLRAEDDSNPVYESFIGVLNEINNEENKHVGQLQGLLKQISPNAELVNRGEVEGEHQLKFINGKLPVETTQVKDTNSNTPNQIDTTCTICDVDDEM